MAVLAFWSDKGGTGKSMLSALAASWGWPMEACLIDLDPQGDSFKWGRQKGLHAYAPGSPVEAQDLILELSERMLVVVDCPPGRLKNTPMAAAGVLASDALILPSGSGKPDLDALARAIRAIEELKARGADFHAGVVLNQYRETTRFRVVQDGMALWKLPYLGRLPVRAAYPEAFAEGRSPLDCGGQAAGDARALMGQVDWWLRARQVL